MESPREVHEEPRHNDTKEETTNPQLHPHPNRPGLATTAIPDNVPNAENDFMPTEPTAKDIEEGANETLAFLHDTTGRTINMESMDSDIEHILYEINRQRKQWSAPMESDARAALQSLYPDNGGSKRHGPL